MSSTKENRMQMKMAHEMETRIMRVTISVFNASLEESLCIRALVHSFVRLEEISIKTLAPSAG